MATNDFILRVDFIASLCKKKYGRGRRRRMESHGDEFACK